MDEEPRSPLDPPAAAWPEEPADVPPSGFVPPVLSGPAAESLAAERARLRAQIDAGASTPEELRALAARLREIREQEDHLWRQEVRPALAVVGLTGASDLERIITAQRAGPSICERCALTRSSRMSPSSASAHPLHKRGGRRGADG